MTKTVIMSGSPFQVRQPDTGNSRRLSPFAENSRGPLPARLRYERLKQPSLETPVAPQPSLELGRSFFTVNHLELHVAHACNLTCESCSHYSNHRHKGMLALEDAEAWLRAWQPRIRPIRFTLLGGEPTLNPDLAGFVRLARRTWPETRLRIVTNGWFLHRHPDLPATLAEDPDVSILISVHHDSPEYREKLQPIFDLAEKWSQNYGIRIDVEASWQRWTRRYRGSGATMEPFEDGRPVQSWANCVAKHTKQLHEGMLWKCAPLAYLGLQHRTVGLSEKWSPYLAYRPLPHDCSDEELGEFLARREESVCGMCPAHPEHMELPVPFTSKGPAKPEAAAPVAGPEPTLRSFVRPRAFPPGPHGSIPFRAFPILRGPTPILRELESHASVLAPGHSPHAPHRHAEEEILLVLDGEAELILGTEGENPECFSRHITCGEFAYYPAWTWHTIRNRGKKPLSYVMFKWTGPDERAGGAKERIFARFPHETGALPLPGLHSMVRFSVLNARTQWLEKLHSHATLLQPGGGYPEHVDRYDVAIVMLKGEVETLGQRVGPAGVIFYAAGEPHGMWNPGPEPALYMVFEFHGPVWRQ